MSSASTRVFAGVNIPDTPLITKALEFAKAHSTDFAYNHVYRSFIFGVIVASKAPELQPLDVEAHAIAAILHDMGWDSTGQYISIDKRFEVDGANAARAFLEKEANPTEWSKARIQLVWDAIALHTTSSIALHKEPEVAATARGTTVDLAGPDGILVTEKEFGEIVKELPRFELGKGGTEIMCGLCKTKPLVTFDGLTSLWGDKYVEGYREMRMGFLDAMEAGVSQLDGKHK